ncbi:MAG: sugar phosphate isomerase/epimerase family protein [Planctomycetales bacterium]
MRYGLNLLLWTTHVDESHSELLGQIKEWGYDGVEVPIFDADPTRYGPLAKRLDALGLERTAVTACAPEINLISADSAIRAAAVEHLKRAIDACGLLGAKLLCGPLHSALGVFTGRGPTAEEWKYGRDGLAAAARHAEGSGVTLAVEPLNRFECYFLNSAADAARLCREIDHPRLGMMYDTFHAHIEEKSVPTAITGCSDRLVHVHLSENDRSTPGEGQVQWATTFATLKGIGYDGWLVIEAFGLALPALAAATKIWRPMFPSEEHVAREGLAFAKRGWEG